MLFQVELATDDGLADLKTWGSGKGVIEKETGDRGLGGKGYYYRLE